VNGKKQKLELTWVGKENRPRLEPRILIEDAAKSYHAAMRVSDGDIFDNVLIHGDNLLALKALEAEYAGKVKCIYIDPPYNTGSAFEHYDDGLEHSIWLSLMRDRLLQLRKLLRNDGFFCCHIDDSEGAYLKVLCDEVFGRQNYLATIYIQVRYPSKTLKQDMDFHKEIEYIHVYRKEYGAKPSLPVRVSSFEKYTSYIRETGAGTEGELGGKRVVIFPKGHYQIEKGEGSEAGLKEIWASGTILDGNSSGRFFRDYLTGRVTGDGLGALYKVYGIGEERFGYRYFTGPNRPTATKGKYYQGVPVSQLEDRNSSSSTLPIENFYNLAGNFGNCRHEGGIEFRSGKKPEALLEMVLRYFSAPGDIVLDSFAGSGTTGAVAHKMGRRWIMVELGNQCDTHVIPRLRSVINASDNSGVTKLVGWKGGGGFRYYDLAPSLLEKDRWDREIISKRYNAEMLAQALCKLEGFTYAPSPDVYWQHGRSTETDFLYVTTQTLGANELSTLSEEVGEGRSLLVLCSAFRGSLDRYPNLTVRKIPTYIRARCEWAHDDYSLNVVNLPMAEVKVSQPNLFGDCDDA
jgi:adenine-specific DNA-methyltransferase